MENDASVPAVSRDMAKKKRVNRSAKLKQCKLDARREQWLSQVKNKGCMATACGGDSLVSSPSPLPPVMTPQTSISVPRNGYKGLESGSAAEHRWDVRVKDDSGLHGRGNNFPVGQENETRFPGTGISSGSSFSSSSEEGREVEKGGLDDWEAVADALTDTNDQDNWRADHDTDMRVNIVESTDSSGVVDEACCTGSAKPISRPMVHRAWMPDDEFRPQSLPHLTKQLSFPVSIKHHCLTAITAGWARHGILSTPSSCPICYEDLDLTDSSFIPCGCGFHLCLFCYNRILETDERCPGCRKQYTPLVGGEVDVRGGRLHFALSLSRSCSMGPRS